MNLPDNYKVQVTSQEFLTIHQLLGVPCVLPSEFLTININGFIKITNNPVLFRDSPFIQIPAHSLITLIKEKTSINDLDKFKDCKQVKCIDNSKYGYKHNSLKVGEVYSLVKIVPNTNLLTVTNGYGFDHSYPSYMFEPVKADTPAQASVSLDDTAMGTRTVNAFKKGDKIYFYGNKEIQTVKEQVGSRVKLEHHADFEYPITHVCLATPKNHKILSHLFPDIVFQKPIVVLTGSALCREKIKRGEVNLLCYVSNNRDNEDNKRAVVSGINPNGQFCTDFGLFNNAVPFDPTTGEPLTEEVK